MIFLVHDHRRGPFLRIRRKANLYESQLFWVQGKKAEGNI